GYNLFLLHRAGFDAHGIDIVQNDFFAARKVAGANGYSAKLAGADVSELPFSESTFSAVTAVETLEHIYAPDRLKAVTEIARILVPGGSFALSTPNYSSLVETGKRLLVRLPFLKRFFPPMCYPVGEVSRSDYHPYSYHRPVTAGELGGMLEEAGFTVMKTRRIIFVWKNVPDCLFPAARLVESILERLPVLSLLASTLVVSARKTT
ncbi:MAG: class I SAM-dependent methyltransferase, partial [Candidatus Krumholzibacteria bacterium]|nr:class I SAM-dependent methyltransferase [Candidatus Krumholzibacteria bacterium]